MTRTHPIRGRRRRILLRWFLIGLSPLLAGVAGAPLLLNVERIHNGLAWRLAAAFGRPVEVGNFDFSIVGGPRIVANEIAVGEDPRFGHEYFLRAERLTASIRWQALLLGKLEYGRLSFTRPSLNLVRLPDGRWNLESWLSRASSAPAAISGARGSSAARLYRVEIDSGRLNFKRGADKHPFALTEVDGSFEQTSNGGWRLDLEATPLRAGVPAQQPGLVRVRGNIGSAAARLQPADLRIQWEKIALSDALRLLRGYDYGVRGGLTLELQARSQSATADARMAADGKPAAPWSFIGEARLAGVHRWNLPERAGDPALNVRIEADAWPQESRLAVTSMALESPASKANGSGTISWAGGEASAGSSLRLLSSGIGLNDLFAWYRAFQPGVALDASMEGNSGLDMELRGWPLRLERAVMAAAGARLRPAGRQESVAIGRAVLRWERDAKKDASRLELLPTVLTFAGMPPAMVRVDASVYPAEGWRMEWNLQGQAARVQEIVAAGAALGVPAVSSRAGPGWTIEGPATLKLCWQGTLYPFVARPSGTVDLRGALLRAPFLNAPVRLAEMRLELAAGERRVTMKGVQAFAAHWNGTLRSKGAGEPWELSLSADRLDAGDLDRWLNPAYAANRPGLLQRLVAGGERPAPMPALLGGLRARGQITVEQFALAPVTLRKLRAGITLNFRQGGEVTAGPSWQVELVNAQAEFHGGVLRGSFSAFAGTTEKPGPSYRVGAQFDGVKLDALTASTVRLKDQFTGTASGQMTFAASGAGRETLRNSLTADGSVEVRGARMTGTDLVASTSAGKRRPGATELRTASGEFTLENRKLQLIHARLLPVASGRSKLPAQEWEAGGQVDLSARPGFTLDLRLMPVAPEKQKSPQRAFRVTGLLAAPQIAPVPRP